MHPLPVSYLQIIYIIKDLLRNHYKMLAPNQTINILLPSDAPAIYAQSQTTASL